ncbi:MAG: hypothetical protein ABUL73_06395 [Alphaproteobacteria bacterium]
MRVVFLAAIAASLAGLALAQPVDNIPNDPSPFPVRRGTAPPPPADARTQAPPPEGAAAGGLDFGQWRETSPRAYETAFVSQMRTRLAGKDAAAIQADLEHNGFACENAARLECRIEISDRQCAYEWYVVLEHNTAEPVAGYETACTASR